MIQTSSAYKLAMKEYFRDNGFIRVSIGVVEHNAQNGLKVDTVSEDYKWWSNLTNPIQQEAVVEEIDYATLEQDFLLCDGTQRFLPLQQDWNNSGYCIISDDILGTIEFELDDEYAIKGITLDFTDNYPTEFVVDTGDNVLTFQNNSRYFETAEVLGNTISHIKITPTSMKGGQQRFRIAKIIMGVGLYLTNTDIADSTLSEEVSPISETLPQTVFNIDVIDYNDKYNIDNPSSYTNFLHTGQSVDVSMGQKLEDGSIEYLNVAKLWLTSWASAYGKMSFTATDMLSFYLDAVYTMSNPLVHSRTAYADCVEILENGLGLESYQYIIDDYLKTVYLSNPYPEVNAPSLLQSLANACRCVIYQDSQQRIIVKPNFMYAWTDDDFTLSSNTGSTWSQLNHILDDSVVVHYADFTNNFSIVNGSMYILPESGTSYIEGRGYVSADVADEDGLFTTNPQIECDMTGGVDFTKIQINFAGNPPSEIVLHTSWNGVANEDIVFNNLENENVFALDSITFDNLEIEVTVGAPHDRVLVDFISLGYGTNFVLDRHSMMDNVLGESEETVREVKVRIFTFNNVQDSQTGTWRTEQVNDSVWYTVTIAPTGTSVEFENQLISTQAMAKDVAEWLGNYYKNDITYTTPYRGEPRIEASDYIKMENNYNDDLIVQVVKQEVSFGGAYSGNLTLRRAMAGE